MKQYDMVVVGSGSGMIVAEEALGHGLKVAVVDRGPIGGTCLNNGCIPSKMLIYPADRVVEVQEARKLGVSARVESTDFAAIMSRMRKSIQGTVKDIRQGISQTENLDFYEGEGHFTDDYTMEVNGEKIKGKTFVLASGSRVLVPPIKGLDKVTYLTNETLLKLSERPPSLMIIGGGYVSVEYAHFFAAMGTRVTIVEMADRLVLAEEPAVSALLQKKLAERMEVHTNTLAEEVKAESDGITLIAKDRKSGQAKQFKAVSILVAVGRRSNADTLKVQNTGVEIDERGYIKINEHLETSKKNIYCFGDATGQQMFTHAANRAAALAAHNILHGAHMNMNYGLVPHAVYSYPQIASIGLTEEKARRDHKILVSVTRYADVAKGEAMMDEESFAKAVVAKENGNILGFHIIGPYAPELIQEVINAMSSGNQIDGIQSGMHIHPALSELVPATLGRLEEV